MCQQCRDNASIRTMHAFMIMFHKLNKSKQLKPYAKIYVRK